MVRLVHDPVHFLIDLPGGLLTVALFPWDCNARKQRLPQLVIGDQSDLYTHAVFLHHHLGAIVLQRI